MAEWLQAGQAAASDDGGDGSSAGTEDLALLRDGQSLSIGDPGGDRLDVSVRAPSPSTGIHEFRFHLGCPRRFSVGFRVPADAVNACVTLNGLLLTGFFADRLPDDAVTPDCMKDPSLMKTGHGHELSSTLAPGRMQILNFRWHPGDVLSVYLYMDCCGDLSV